ncbi:MAG: hypothetical protein HQL67_06555 [Magnetococcales bacterium]|nr:hypothetical protein [Magnetococcales bacterium]
MSNSNIAYPHTTNRTDAGQTPSIWDKISRRIQNTIFQFRPTAPHPMAQKYSQRIQSARSQATRSGNPVLARQRPWEEIKHQLEGRIEPKIQSKSETAPCPVDAKSVLTKAAIKRSTIKRETPLSQPDTVQKLTGNQQPVVRRQKPAAVIHPKPAPDNHQEPAIQTVQPALPAQPTASNTWNPIPANSADEPEVRLKKETTNDPQPEWRLVLSDTDNDIETTLYTLWLTGICDRDGQWTPGIANRHIIHTGDWLNKWKPCPKAVKFFRTLQETAPPHCSVTLINGNHELAILKMAADGLSTPLSKKDLAFIRDQQIIHIASDTLFIHGYPTLALEKTLTQMAHDKMDMSDYAEHLKSLFFAKKQPLFSTRLGYEIIGDIRNPKPYYEKNIRGSKITHGQKISQLLLDLGLKTVIHGHKPNDETQVDQEFSDQLPGIRMINNDNRVKESGFGGLLLPPQGETLFLNPTLMKKTGGEKTLRKTLRKQLKTRNKDLGTLDQVTDKIQLDLVA